MSQDILHVSLLMEGWVGGFYKVFANYLTYGRMEGFACYFTDGRFSQDIMQVILLMEW